MKVFQIVLCCTRRIYNNLIDNLLSCTLKPTVLRLTQCFGCGKWEIPTQNRRSTKPVLLATDTKATERMRTCQRHTNTSTCTEKEKKRERERHCDQSLIIPQDYISQFEKSLQNLFFNIYK